MMMNLFSMFDPSLMNFNLSWMPVLLPILFMFYSSKYNLNYKIKIMIKFFFMFLEKELNSLMYPNKKKMSSSFLMSLFFFILFLNLIALTPFTFTPTAHLSLSFTLASSMWLSFLLMGWSKNFKSMMAHMVPTGTPPQLMNFMVLIELVSNLIRPITLSVRLSANMVAGHLLMSLLGGFCLSSMFNLSSFPMMLALSVLELGVSLIQAYVFMTLITLYSTEIH